MTVERSVDPLWNWKMVSNIMQKCREAKKKFSPPDKGL